MLTFQYLNHRSMKTTHYHNFQKLFDALLYRHDVPTVFDDFLTLTLSALAIGRAESVYEETIKRYRPEDQAMFGKMFAELFLAYDERSSPDGGWTDILGHFFEEYNGKFGRDARGQFFTPESVCNFMAQIVTDGPSEGTINDCAVGSGRNLIAHSRTHPSNRTNCFYVGQDIDHRCVKMTAINMAMYGMRGVSIHMDTLRMEIWGGYRVWLPETGLGVQPLTKQQCISFLMAEREETEPKPLPVSNDDLPVIKEAVRVNKVKPEQLSLF